MTTKKNTRFMLPVILLSSFGFSQICAAMPTFRIGNETPGTTFFVQGQSFTPAISGNDGFGSPIPNTDGNTVFLQNFTLDFVTTPFSFLSIYETEPTVSNASTGAGSIGTGIHVGGGVYDFTAAGAADGLSIPFNAKSFAVLPRSASIRDGSGNRYTGGIDMFPFRSSVREGGGDFDTGFRATFYSDAEASVPEPASILLLGLGLFSFLFSGVNRKTRRQSVARQGQLTV